MIRLSSRRACADMSSVRDWINLNAASGSLQADEMLKKLVDYAKSIGANGLLDYRFEAVRPVKSNFNQVLYYRLTAFAISI